ncbi:MAG: hypothetical protein J5614_06235 [Paludibacteraceae bacterium]|nr:hypothetical protein [Paludibacteraceae bacterium]
MTIKQQVEKVIAESDSLIQALESVAAMYNIPASNILVNDQLNSIRVQGDTILAPDKKNPSANTQAIVCAIGAVLDNIGQRIDAKLDAFQSSQISQNVAKANQREADPSKGEVVGRFFDSEGSEIIAYSTGLVDMSPTKASIEKVRELRASKQIPDIQDQVSNGPTGYFSDEDDIAKGAVPCCDPKVESFNIAEQIGEDPAMIDLYDYFGGSKTIGHDLLQEQGFDYVDATHALIQEGDDDKAEKAPANSKNLKHMRFDNSHLMKAVDLFNEAFNKVHPEGAEFAHVDTESLMGTSEWKEAVREIESQFKAKLTIKWFSNRDTNCFTWIDDSKWRPKLTISKSKGFQLGGMDIGIGIAGKMLDQGVAKKDRKNFGQTIMSVFLHEIFHNISAMLRFYDYDFITSMSSTLMLAGATNSVKARRIIFSNYAKSITGVGGKKLNLFQRQKLVRQLMYVSTVQDDAKRAAEVRKRLAGGECTPEEVEDLVKKMEHYVDHSKREMEKNKTTGRKVLSGILIVGGIIASLTFILLPLGLAMIMQGYQYTITPEKFQSMLKEYTSHPNKEEYYCDMFAGIYNLPPVFLLGGDALTYGMTPNELDEDLLKRLSAVEKELYQMIFTTYPTDAERGYAAYKMASKALKEKKALSPECKDYLEWVVKNYSKLEDTGIKENYNQATFNPKECEDLDEHIQRIIDKSSSVQVTESYKPR